MPLTPDTQQVEPEQENSGLDVITQQEDVSMIQNLPGGSRSITRTTNKSRRASTSRSSHRKRTLNQTRRVNSVARGAKIKKSENIERPPKSNSATDPSNKLEQFSIHKIDLRKVAKKYALGVTHEKILIAKIMEEVNLRHTLDEKKFEERPEQIRIENANNTHNFETVLYAQEITKLDGFLRLFDYPNPKLQINWIVFYYKKSDIFALTRGISWKIIQGFCCYEFPIQISRRLTSAEGSYNYKVKLITGNEQVKTCNNSLPTLFDQLNTIEYSMTKEFRTNSSIYRLSEFSREKKPRIRIGMAYVRFLQPICIINLPEILNHLSIIASNGKTFDTEGQAEEDNSEVPKLRPASALESHVAEGLMYQMLYEYMTANNTRICDIAQINHKYVETFRDAPSIKLTYSANAKHVEIENFVRIPTTQQILSKLIMQEQLSSAKNIKMFQRRLQNVRVTFESNGEKVVDKFVNCMEMELCSDAINYWKTLGVWRIPRDEYYYEVHKSFIALLNEENVLTVGNQEGNLLTPWNAQQDFGVSSYLGRYRNREREGYFVSDPPINSKYFFDMLYIPETAGNAGNHTYIYFIFDNFDGGMGGQATRVEKAIENIFVNKEAELLKGFYTGHHETLTQYFPSVEDFVKHFHESRNVFVVLAFNTAAVHSRYTINSSITKRKKSQITDYFEPRNNRVPNPNGEMGLIATKFNVEQALQLRFTQANVSELVIQRMTQSQLRTLMNHLETDEVNPSQAVINQLVKKGYCNEPEECNVRGALLKLRRPDGFNFSESEDVNMVVFDLLKASFMSQFPGIIEKLECLQIQKCLTERRLQLRIVEIAIQNE